MSYTNGIGSPQHIFTATETSASSSASRTVKAEAAFVPMPDGSSSATPVDEAKLSATASVVAQALSGSDVRAEKVSALQQAIAAGTYNVSSSDLAAKVLSALLN